MFTKGISCDKNNLKLANDQKKKDLHKKTKILKKHINKTHNNIINLCQQLFR